MGIRKENNQPAQQSRILRIQRQGGRNKTESIRRTFQEASIFFLLFFLVFFYIYIYIYIKKEARCSFYS